MNQPDPYTIRVSRDYILNLKEFENVLKKYENKILFKQTTLVQKAIKLEIWNIYQKFGRFFVA